MKKTIIIITLSLSLLFRCSSNSDSDEAAPIIKIPTLKTRPIYYLTDTAGVSGGVVTNNGGADVTTEGVVWSETDSLPTIALSTKTALNGSAGVYSSSIQGLTIGTTYYIRAYATNDVGTGYGNTLVFMTLSSTSTVVVDVEHNSYPIITIGNQIWSKKNLYVSHYRNGDPIPQVTDPTAFATLTTGAWCYYNNDSANGATYGKLYNWYAVNDPRGLAPQAWHVPTYGDWSYLVTYLGGDWRAGGKMKTTTGWLTNYNSTNSSLFSGLPGGGCGLGIFSGIVNFGYWSCSTEVDNVKNWSCRLTYNSEYATIEQARKVYGYSVRCIKD